MRFKLVPSLLSAWLLWSVSTGAQWSVAEPSPVRSPNRATVTTVDRMQITAGDFFRKDRDFEEAEAAYIRALQSVDQMTREKALRSLEHSLSQRHDFWVLVRQSLHGIGESVVHLLPLGLFVVVLWCAVGLLGNLNGRRRCILEDLDKSNPGFAKTFHLAYLKALEERRRACLLGPGPLGSRSVAPVVEVIPAIENAMGEIALGQLMSLANKDADKIVSVLVSRFRRPRLRLRVALQDKAPLALVGLEDRGKVVQVWSEPLGVSDLFKPRCRLLRKIMAYIEEKISAEDQ